MVYSFLPIGESGFAQGRPALHGGRNFVLGNVLRMQLADGLRTKQIGFAPQ
ncbi:unnamed protein product [Penicillium roqueforti FM164]|uniref:Genomic scaffold, ProqFM164S01 n=1 Tax=Penicillium roqueforti (strain FM164) TaxID=1365484 RepID=W6PSZ1_PENRF|nr:unnamed protein product [Penicillium roqueforti FM164]